MERSLRLTYIFQHRKEPFIHPFRLKSAWIPPKTRNQPLEQYLQQTRLELQQTANNPLPRRPNITHLERRAINTLKRNPNIYINKADKGSNITILDKDKYISEGEDHLSNPDTYTAIPLDPSPDLAARIRAYAKALFNSGFIDQTEMTFLTPKNPVKTQAVYFLRKIHKTPHQIRPIVSGINGPTCNISAFLDYFFKPLLPSIPSYLKDTNQLLATLKTLHLDQPENTLLVTMDINAMYPSIPQDEGIQTLLKYDQLLPFPKIVTTRLLNFILKENYFSFNQTIYHQTKGVAMGTPIAPTFANFFMHDLEQRFFTTQSHLPLLYKRYIDDIFIVWTHGEEAFNQFFQSFNSFHPNITFTSNKSTTSVNFLDITIFKSTTNPHQLQSKLYSKPTASFQYIHYTSNHPKSTKLSIIYGEALRILRNTSMPSDQETSLKQLTTHFRNREYPLATIKKIIQKARSHIPIATCKQDQVFLKTKHDERRPALKHHLQTHKHLLLQDPLLHAIHNKQARICKVNHPNIAKSIIRNALSTDSTTNPIPNTDRTYTIPSKVHHCSVRGCGTCPLLWCRGAISGTSTYTKIKITQKLSCSSTNVIYVIQCSFCNLQYVGRTSCTLRNRTLHHRNKFFGHQPYRPLLYKHFDQHGWSNFTITPIAQVPPDWLSWEESKTIDILNTVHPNGLNSKRGDLHTT